MSLGNLVNAFRGQLLAREAQSMQTIETAHKRMMDAVKPVLGQFYQEAKDKKKSDQADTTTPMAWLYEKGRLAQLRQSVADKVSEFAQTAQDAVAQAVPIAATLGTQFAQAAVQVLSGENIVVRQRNTLPSYVQPMLSSMFDAFGNTTSERVAYTLTAGLSIGNDLRQIASEVSQALDVPRWRALTIAASEIFKAYNNAAHVLYRDNAHLIKGWIWHCQLSRNSCVACVALHGSKHGLDEQLNDHPHGNCTPIPYIDDDMEIESGAQWFAKQPESLQRMILGTNVAYDLYASGKATLQDFVGIHDHPKYGPTVYQRSAKEIRDSSI